MMTVTKKHRQKTAKLAYVLLLLALAISLTACGGGRSVEADTSAFGGSPNYPVPNDGGSTAISGSSTGNGEEYNKDEDAGEGYPVVNEWPASHFPEGFPEYPAEYYTIAEGEGNCMVFIDGTNRAEYDAYLKELAADGWAVDESNTDMTDLNYIKASWWLSVSYYAESSVSIYISGYEFDLGTTINEWPKNLPSELPEYMDGEVAVADSSDSDFRMIVIKGTSEAAFQNYIDMVEDSGWMIKGDSTGNLITAEKNGWRLLLNLSDGTNVIITLNDIR